MLQHKIIVILYHMICLLLCLSFIHLMIKSIWYGKGRGISKGIYSLWYWNYFQIFWCYWFYSCSINIRGTILWNSRNAHHVRDRSQFMSYRWSKNALKLCCFKKWDTATVTSFFIFFKKETQHLFRLINT